jgi:hypothetical protein
MTQNLSNIQALGELLLRVAPTCNGQRLNAAEAGWLAAALANLGVLVPSALTDADCATVREASTERYEGFLIEAEMRAALERIAKGEPTPHDPGPENPYNFIDKMAARFRQP